MSVRLRLQRHGRKGQPIFTIVATDSRSRRDGRFIEKIGQYNPNTNPATIDLDFDAALRWINNGAQPSETVRAILRYKGVMLRKHLEEGVKKGALTEEQVQERFDQWLSDKIGKIEGKKDHLSKSKETEMRKRLEKEAEVNAKREEALKARLAAAEPVAEEAVEAATEAEASVEAEAPAESAEAAAEAAAE
ncbi:30S ribosomal protein S16 [bacterium]|nr:30S ribosomal protein S16 [bacterium]